MSGLEALLRRLGASCRHELGHPGSYDAGPRLAPSPQLFRQALERVHARAAGPVTRAELAPTLRRLLPATRERKRVVAEASAAALVPSLGLDVASPGVPPASFESVEVALVRGALGVVEDGSVAVLGGDAPQRALLFLARRLVLLLATDTLCATLHEAFARLPAGALEHHHLTWISGPSKTADIEQTLVLGAHGPEVLDVLLFVP